MAGVDLILPPSGRTASTSPGSAGVAVAGGRHGAPPGRVLCSISAPGAVRAGAARLLARAARGRDRRAAPGACAGPVVLRAVRGRGRPARGSLVRPTTGERFDQIVSNSAVRAGPALGRLRLPRLRPGWDAALAALLGELPGVLNPRDRAAARLPWLHVRGEDWLTGCAPWLPAGVDAWALQREVVDPALHVGTWQRDVGLDVTSPRPGELRPGLAGLGWTGNGSREASARVLLWWCCPVTRSPS
ncbi:hypothetical protein HBB16_16585 [Pseudonocardia sp. MCCB 268]|nr:hypothetical protein [Pseudonocardia cytotoxica]